MKTIILKGSPRKNGNTASLLKPLVRELKDNDMEVREINLVEKEIKQCIDCKKCQQVSDRLGCIYNDDLEEIFNEVIKSDLIILATPIYSWYCTPPMKAVLDRFVYGMNKYNEDGTEKSFWAGKDLALVTTCGYSPKDGADLWEEGAKRYAEYSGLNYLGMLAESESEYEGDFMDNKKRENAVRFAKELLNRY